MLIESMFAKIFFFSLLLLAVTDCFYIRDGLRLLKMKCICQAYLPRNILFSKTVCSISEHQDLKQTKGDDPPKFSLPNMYMDIFCILLSLSTSGGGKRERNAWMEMTIIHQFLLPPLPSSSPANAFAKDILFTQCDLFSTDTP